MRLTSRSEWITLWNSDSWLNASVQNATFGASSAERGNTLSCAGASWAGVAAGATAGMTGSRVPTGSASVAGSGAASASDAARHRTTEPVAARSM